MNIVGAYTGELVRVDLQTVWLDWSVYVLVVLVFGTILVVCGARAWLALRGAILIAKGGASISVRRAGQRTAFPREVRRRSGIIVAIWHAWWVAATVVIGYILFRSIFFEGVHAVYFGNDEVELRYRWSLGNKKIRYEEVSALEVRDERGNIFGRNRGLTAPTRVVIIKSHGEEYRIRGSNSAGSRAAVDRIWHVLRERTKSDVSSTS